MKLQELMCRWWTGSRVVGVVVADAILAKTANLVRSRWQQWCWVISGDISWWVTILDFAKYWHSVVGAAAVLGQQNAVSGWWAILANLGGGGGYSWAILTGGSPICISQNIGTLIAATDACMHGLGFADVRKIGSILKPATALHACSL